jgi:hypothetical protein
MEMDNNQSSTSQPIQEQFTSFQPISFPPQPPKKKSNKIPLIIAVIVIVTLVVGFFLLRRPSQQQSEEKSSPAPTEAFEQLPTQEPSPAVKKGELKIQILNGTGKPGQAAQALALLKDAGFNESNIKTGNAQNYATQPTTIKIKKGLDSYATEIKNLLQKSFDEVKIDTNYLDAIEDYDIVITTGGKKYEEPTSTPAPTSSASSPSPTSTPTTTPTNTPAPSPTQGT